MSAIPQIPASVQTVPQLDDWIDANASDNLGLAARLRMMVAVMDRASEIGARLRTKELAG